MTMVYRGPDLNADCWLSVLTELSETSVTELLKCATINRHFKSLVDQHPYWAVTGARLNMKPPKPRARMYKTWKSLVWQKRGKFCERCYGRTYNRPQKLQVYTRFAPLVAFVCSKCFDICQPAEVRRARILKLRYIRDELADNRLFERRSVAKLANTLDDYDTNCWLKGDSLQNETWWSTDVVRTIAERITAYLERDKLVTEKFKDVVSAGKVCVWVKRGVGDINRIVDEIRARQVREAALTERMSAYNIGIKNSVTCAYYIEHGGDIEAVVVEMREWDWWQRGAKYSGFSTARLKEWVKRFLDGNKNFTTAEDFVHFVPSIPPESLRSKLVSALSEELQKRLMELLMQTIPQVKDLNAPPELSKKSLTRDVWEQAKRAYLERYGLDGD